LDWNFWPDQRLMHAVDDHRSGWLTSAARAVMWLGTSPSVLAGIAAVALIVMALRRSYRPAVAGGVAAVSAGIAASLLKDVFDRPRPPASLSLVHAAGSSFPSDLAAATAALATALFVATTWADPVRARTMATALAAAVIVCGLCMVYLGAHWPTDVLAGWVLGVALGLFTGRAVRRLTGGRERASIGSCPES
jgi:undecaprenyl-diphosphatase